MRLPSLLTLPVLLLVLSGTAWAARAPKPGAVTQAQFKSWQRTGEVTDLANLLDEAVEEKLRNQAREVRAKSGVELAVATVPGLPSGNWDKDLVALARRWEVGGREKGLGNTGVLLVLMPRDERWVLLWGYPGEGSRVVFAAERGGRPGFVGLGERYPPVQTLTEEFRVLAQLYAAYYGFALEPSGPRPGPVPSTAAERTAVIDDAANLLDAQARARLVGTLDEVRRHTGAEWIVTTTAGSAEATGWSSVDPQEFVEALGLKTRLQDRRSGELLAVIRASDGAGNFTAGAALQAALHAEPSAFRAPPLYERDLNKVAPGKTLDFSLRDFARRYAAHGGWALSPRWTQGSGLPPPRPDASISWAPPPPVAPKDSGRTGVAGAGTPTGQGGSSGGVTSSPRGTSLVGSMFGAYLPLMVLVWFWLTARALVVDRRGAWVRLLLVCVLGAPCGMALLALFSAGVFSSMRDKLPDGPAALVGSLGGIALGILLVEAVANPTFRKHSGGRLHSYFDLRKPTLSARWQRPGLMLCRWGLAGVGVGCIALGIAFGFAGGDVVALNSGRIQPAYVALGLALALVLFGAIKVAATELARAR